MWNFNVESLFHQVMLTYMQQTTVWKMIEDWLCYFFLSEPLVVIVTILLP